MSEKGVYDKLLRLKKQRQKDKSLNKELTLIGKNQKNQTDLKNLFCKGEIAKILLIWRNFQSFVVATRDQTYRAG